MPYISALPAAYLIFSVYVFRYIGNTLKHATKTFTGLPAWRIIGIAGDYSGSLAGQAYLTFNQSASPVSKMLTAEWRIDMIPDVTVIIYESAFTVTKTDLSDFCTLIMKGNPPDLFMTESEFPVRCADMNRNQINDSV